MTHTMTLRLDDDAYEEIRREAFERRVSLSAVIRERLSPAQDNPEAWVTAPDGEEFRRGACQGHDCCTAKLHEHGCFADYDGSKCDHPEAHRSTGEQAEYLCYICGGRPQEQGGVCSDECETSVNTESTVPSPDVRPKNGEKP